MSPTPSSNLTLDIQIEEAFELFPAKVRATFGNVDAEPDAGWLKAVLKQLPRLLDTLADSDRRDRIENIARALCSQFRRFEFQGGAWMNGNDHVNRFFRTIPLLSEQDIRDRFTNADALPWSDLMRVSYGDQIFYVADQFELDGAVNPVFLHIVKSFRASPHHTEWGVALWWINPNGWLGGARPCDIYREDPEQLKHALEQEIVKFEC